MSKNYDFGGYATKNDLRCSDGKIIRKDAFKHCDGKKVPLLWNHEHNMPSNVIGHAILKNLNDGVYAYGYLNNSTSGQDAREAIMHGDVDSLSIYANHITTQNGGDVVHGDIKEVSVVVAGANPGAHIDSVIEHMDGCEEEAVIFTGELFELFHADEEEKPAAKEESKEPEKKEDSDKTVKEVFDSMNNDQKNVCYALIGQALKGKSTDDDEDDTEEKGDKESMKHNIFDGQEAQGEVLSHADMEAIFSDAKETGSLKNAVIRHGITDIEMLYPEAKSLNTPPDWIKREDAWVTTVISGVHKTPFTRVKSMFANITADEARAKGYIKGNKKVEEVFTLLKRTTDPQTIYKLQKLDRDDILDITDFDVVSWIKGEMKGMLNEELARAILIGDGRSSSSNDKINPLHIRPIWTDEDLYTIKYKVELSTNATADEKAKAAIRASIKSRKDYRGSGNPVFFTTEDYLTDMLLLEDNNGRVIYDTEEKLRTALRVSKIITVPVMEGLTRTDADDGTTRHLFGLIVNLVDYNLGNDKGGEPAMFDDFDIDYNKYTYLIETRRSGAMTKPFSAIALEMVFQ